MYYDECPRTHEINSYLKQHKILELLESMTSILITKQPENPRQFLIEQLERLREARDSNSEPPSLFTEGNAESIFSMLDPCEKNAIGVEQYVHGLKTLGLKKINPEPELNEDNEVLKHVFMTEA